MQQKRRIVIVASVPPPLAGQSAATSLLLAALLKEEADVRVVDIGDDIGGRHTVSASVRRSYAVIGIWCSVARASVGSRRNKTTLYLQLGQSPFAMLRDIPVLLLSRVLGWKCVGHVHGGGWRAAYDSLPSLLKRIYSALIVGVDQFVVLTPRLTSMASGVVPESAVVVVGNGVDPDLEHAAAEGPSILREPAVVLFLSNLIPAKGANTVIDAARLAHDGGQSTVFVLAGSIPSGHELPELPPNAKYVGAVHDASKNELFRSASVFALPTSYPIEGEPIAILEAMHFGLPVVTCDQGGIADVIGRPNGLIVPSDDPGALLDAVNELCGDHKRWAEISSVNRRTAKLEHSSESHQNRMVALLLGDASEDSGFGTDEA